MAVLIKEVILETPVRITHPSCEIVGLEQP